MWGGTLAAGAAKVCDPVRTLALKIVYRPKINVLL